MKKIILLLILSFMLTGCSAEYDLSYFDGVLNESFSVISNMNDTINGESFSVIIDDYYNNNYLLVNYKDEPGDMPIEEIELNYEVYNKSILNYNNKYGLKLEYIYDDNNIYTNSSIVHTLFNNLYVGNSTIKASSINNIFVTYPDLSDITIKFSTDMNVLVSNCDEEKDGVLYWYINKDNYIGKYIEVDFDTSYSNNEVVSDGYINWNGIKYIIGGIVIVILISIVVIYEKVKKSNR